MDTPADLSFTVDDTWPLEAWVEEPRAACPSPAPGRPADPRDRPTPPETDYPIRTRSGLISLRDAAAQRGRPYSVIRARYERGERGATLFRPVDPAMLETDPDDETTGADPEDDTPVFQIGLSEASWTIIVQEARAEGVRAIAQRHGLPPAAVRAALRDEFERLD